MKPKVEKSKSHKSEIMTLNEKVLHKASNLCSNLKLTRSIGKKPKKVQTNLKKVKFMHEFLLLLLQKKFQSNFILNLKMNLISNKETKNKTQTKKIN